MTLWVCAGCGSTKDLQPEQKALVKNVYHLITEDDRVDKSQLRGELKSLIKQNPVKKGVLNPRTWGTPLTIYDQKLTVESASAMEQYLRNRKGFYHAVVEYVESTKNKKVSVTYKVMLAERYYVGVVTMECSDSTLYNLFEAHVSEQIVKTGDPLDARLFDEEEARLLNLAKNNGYADFTPQFVEFRGDSTETTVPVKIFVYPPLGKESHQPYKIGDINIYTEHVATPDPSFTRSDTLAGIQYFAKSSQHIVRPEVISKVLSIEKGAYFSRQNEFLTNRTLSRLSPYRFVRLDPVVENDSILNYNIFLTPLDNKWSFDMGANLFYSLLEQAPSVSVQDLFGFGGNLGWTNRNFRNRAISHSFGLEGTFEFRIPSFAANTFSIQANNSFRIPHIVDVFRMSPFLNKLGLLTDKSYNNLNLYGNTEVDFSLGITDILGAYRLNTVNASWSYNFQPDEYNRYIWTQIGVSALNTKVDPIFQESVLDLNPLLEASFSSYLFTGFLFRELNIYRQSKETSGGSQFTFLGNIEISGLENWLINRGVNALTSFDDRWTLAQLDFAEFVRLEADIRYYKRVKERSSFAARFNIGTALTYADEPVIPFVKSFFVGGPNSLRGWQLRELGPGSFIQTTNDDPTFRQPFFQTGDFKLEMNMEYRFDLFWFWEGAIFVDAGNVWTLKNDPLREGSQISGSFLNEMAVSTGWGLRFDFDYFLLRFDFGYKLRSPFPDPVTNSHIVFTNKEYNGSILGNVNFAINYPF